MGKASVRYRCTACGQPSPAWAGRCLECGEWGRIEAEAAPVRGGSGAGSAVTAAPLLGAESADPPRLRSGLGQLDSVLGGGLVAGSVVLLAGPPGIGKSTLLLQWLAAMGSAGVGSIVASGEESRGQVAARAGRLGVPAEPIAFAPGRDLDDVVAAARAASTGVLAVDSIQTLRDPSVPSLPGGIAQVRGCADALVELAKTQNVAVVLTGHITKDGDLAGPRALEHAVDVVLGFEGDPRSGLRILTARKNRFGAEGETAWFQMGSAGLEPIDAADLLHPQERIPGAAVCLPLAGRRALAVEIQALVGGSEGGARRQVTGLDLRRFQQVAAVLDRSGGIPIGRAELFGAAAGGVRVDDPASDLAVAMALASAATGVAPPAGAAFVGELALTGQVRPVPGMEQRIGAARAAGCSAVVGPGGPGGSVQGLRVVTVSHIAEALERCLSPAGTFERRRAS